MVGFVSPGDFLTEPGQTQWEITITHQNSPFTQTRQTLINLGFCCLQTKTPRIVMKFSFQFMYLEVQDTGCNWLYMYVGL